ncbi:pentapeptide repeat-containing protein [bacterium]|nr:pentapeptide repeat-containing protein [bacterium]
MRRALAAPCGVVLALSLGVVSLSRAQDTDGEKKPKPEKKPAAKGGDEAADDDDATERLAPEARLCFKLAKGEVISGLAVEPYIDLLTDEDTAGWNKRRKKDKGKVLDLGGKTWEPKRREDLALKLEGLDLSGADFSGVLFMPGTSFRGSDLTGAVFHGTLLEGVSFSNIRGFEAREKKSARSTVLDEADFKDAVWTWCSALERTAKRCREGPAKPLTPEERQRRMVERQRRRAFGYAEDPFAFVDLSTAKVDADSPLGTAFEDDTPRHEHLTPALARLVKFAAADSIERAIARIAARTPAARSRECPNPLAHEPALADAIASADTRLAGIATWKAVHLSEPLMRQDEVTVVGGKDVIFVLDDARSLQGARVVVSEGPILAWGSALLPTTFSPYAIVLKDQAQVRGVLHGHPIFALSDPVRDARRGSYGGAGTFYSEVIVEVAKVENLSAADVERRKLKETTLKEYARSQGDDLDHQNVFDPTDTDGADPEKMLTDEMRRSIVSQVGKKALADMKCYKVGAHKFPQNPSHYHVLSVDPKAILVVTAGFASSGSIYSEGPVVLTDGDRTPHTRCVTKSWIVVEGKNHRVSPLALGEHIDVEPEADEDKKAGK